jgi:ATP-dependent exoDNAse (exonuclease V) beta subunit
MKTPARVAAWLIPFLLVGCVHKNTTQVQPLAPPIEDTPPPKPSVAPADLPPPVVTVPPQTPSTDTNANAQTQPPPKPPAKHKKPQQQPAQPAQQAAAETPGVSAIGQLSSGAPSDQKQQTSDSIAATEKGLNGITRTLNDQEQKTAAQIKEWLKQAKDALATGDVDGARTLAAKAKALLTELNQ